MRLGFLKRAVAVLVTALAIPLNCAAGSQPEQLPAYITPGSVARYIIENGTDRKVTALECLNETRDGETLAYYIAQVYGLEPDSWTDCVIYRAGGTEAFEIAVIRTAGEDEAKKAAKALEGYIGAREADFTGYEPAQAAVVHDSAAAFSANGDAALLICEDAAAAEQAFQDSYQALIRWPFDPPGTDDMTIYDTSAILAAWESGDASSLSEKDAALLSLAAGVLDEVVEEDMPPLERERAIYQWITANTVYDQDHYDPLATLDPDSSNPYGALHNGKAICLGFATAFQLFMDMLDVECITVVGAYHQCAEDHAWNMVRLDGRWYCADPTWDAGSPPESWEYFNVPSDLMARTNHQWDYDAVPEADGYGPRP